MNMNKHREEDDVFTLYSLLESRIEMLEEHVSMLKSELAFIKKIIENKHHGSDIGRF